jgi:chorismate lyase/3-hydroxybenzoate synthase
MTVEFALGDPGDYSKGLLGIGIPLLGGEPRETIMGAVEPAEGEGGFAVWRGAGRAVGIARSGAGIGIEEATSRAYAGLLRAAGGLNLYRIWNLVPSINGCAPDGLENYQRFCRARSLAFESALGTDFPRSLPAASAVGTAEAGLTVVFLAGSRPARHFENPAQVPAYRYPPEHGPRPPSFARATVAEGDGGVDVFVSGTSAVVGHETVAPYDTAGQLDRTIENLMLISRACGLGDRLGSGARCRRHFKVFLRNAGDLAPVSLEMGRRMLVPGDRVSYLGADICRSALNVEIEVAVRGADRI